VAQSRQVTVVTLRQDEPVRFAAEELKKYLERMDQLQVTVGPAPNRAADISLGLFEDFGLPAPSVRDPTFDDRLHVDVQGLRGVIAGSNPRSVLFAVYRLLEQAGCRWVRPRADGEHIPHCDTSALRVSLDEAPSYRYRGICIEGAVSYQNMLDNVEWAPKVGFNSYFLEFLVPYTFFDRWYRHLNNPTKQPEPVSIEQVVEFRRGIEREIARRGLIYHAMGHGWTCEPLGIPGLAWEPGDWEVRPEVKHLLAEINGQRALFHGVPLNTNLCYSNPEARRLVVDYAVRHVEDNPGIGVLHVWLADGANNHCECADCQRYLPSDLYVRLLNEMDAAFTARGIPTKIAFIAYLDLLWAPREERLVNPERFVLLFAPISRSYSRPYETDLSGVTLPEYQRNRLRFPANIRENLAYLAEWQKVFPGDAFTYEYYFMWDCYLDPGYYEAAKVLIEDVKRLRQVGLNGIISDQSQRSFFPTGFGMWVLARTLWDERSDFDTLARDYFAAAFGAEGEAAREYLARLSAAFDPPYLRGERTRAGNRNVDTDSHVWILDPAGQEGADEQAAERLRTIPELIDGFLPTIEANLAAPDLCHARSWEVLRYHADIARGLALAFQRRAEGRQDQARALWEEVARYVQRAEDALQPVLDVFEFIGTLGSRFR